MTTVNTTYSSREGAIQNYFFPLEEPLKKSSESFFLCVDSNHLGNVMAVVSDKKIPVDDRYWDYNTNQWVYSPDGTIDYFAADVISTVDYYPFGMEMPGRKTNPSSYSYGFNGKRYDSEWNGNPGAMYDYGFRIYDPRIARFLSVNPLTKDYPWYTPYQFAGNKPIIAIDLDGKEEHVLIHFYDRQGEWTGSTLLYIPDERYRPLGPHGILEVNMDASNQNRLSKEFTWYTHSTYLYTRVNGKWQQRAGKYSNQSINQMINTRARELTHDYKVPDERTGNSFA